MIAEAAARLAVLLLEEQLRWRRAAPRPLQLQILLGHHGHLDLRLARHGGRASSRPMFGDPRALHDGLRPFGKDTRLVTSITQHDRPGSRFTLPSEAHRLHRRRSDGRALSIRHAERFQSLASHIRRYVRRCWRPSRARGHVATSPSAGCLSSSWIGDGSLDRATFVSDTLDDRMIGDKTLGGTTLPSATPLVLQPPPSLPPARVCTCVCVCTCACDGTSSH